MATVLIEVFTSPTCTHCPAAVKATKELFRKHEELKKDVTWKEMSTGTPAGYNKARTYGISSVPTIILTNLKTNERFGVGGAPNDKKYIDMIYNALGKSPEKDAHKEIKKEHSENKSNNEGGLIDKFANLFR
ncbi:hypothetical protein MSIBF_A4390004 [groundwater metagenome]|uniref:Thioredoxin-like fold domain-containing protein n=1 Tax=groundwater metagenome TaxID=717931 RepID=A0A098EDR3_9ZZZZ